VISNNTTRKPKTLWTDNDTGSKIRRFQVADDRTESELVVRQMKDECASNGYAFSDVALFYRTNAQSRVFEDVLRREKIPYKIIGGLKFYDRKEIKDVIAYFRALVNPSDSVSLKRIINVPQRSIGKATVEKIEEQATANRIGFDEALRQAAGPADWLSGGPKRKVGEFVVLMNELREQLPKKSLSELYHELLDRTRYVEELKAENTDEAHSRIENLQELDSTLVEFETGKEEAKADVLLSAFLEDVTLAVEREQTESDAGSVSLMTLHTSKGLEFPLVFMVGLEEGLFPSIRPYEEESEEDIEEERRLCYVGMTRAKRRLYMTHAVCRRVYGNIVYHDPSRFLSEIPEEYVEFANLTRYNAPSGGRLGGRDDDDYYEDVNDRDKGSGGRRTAPSYQTQAETGGVSIGSRVRHSTYGVGVIRGVEGMSENAKVTIEFGNRQTKKFVLKFANLEVI
jgi:DNA helicase-2/ATP-dependent DNA helicase PcrA